MDSKDIEKIAFITVDAAEELCSSIDGFDDLSNDCKVIALIFASVGLLNYAFRSISEMIERI